MKQKPVLLAPRNQTREVGEADAARLLQTGSWCRVAGVKPITASAAKQRQFRAACTAQGKRRLSAYVSSAVFDQWQEVKRPDESNAELITRLLRIAKLLG